MSASIKLALRDADLVVREYVRNLEAQNAKLQKEIARFECSKMDYKITIATLRKELNACIKKAKNPLTVIVNRGGGKEKSKFTPR